MSEPEKRSDAELQAMLVLVKYLEPLARPARRRVLRWAEDRFVSGHVDDLDPEFFTKFTEGIQQAARDMGAARPLDLIEAATEFARYRKEREAAQGAVEEES